LSIATSRTLLAAGMALVLPQNDAGGSPDPAGAVEVGVGVGLGLGLAVPLLVV
jgi:hypothetical protein